MHRFKKLTSGNNYHFIVFHTNHRNTQERLSLINRHIEFYRLHIEGDATKL